MSVVNTGSKIKERRIKKRTAIGNSDFSRPTNKQKKRNHKRYRGQGK